MSYKIKKSRYFNGNAAIATSPHPLGNPPRGFHFAAKYKRAGVWVQPLSRYPSLAAAIQAAKAMMIRDYGSEHAGISLAADDSAA